MVVVESIIFTPCYSCCFILLRVSDTEVPLGWIILLGLSAGFQPLCLPSVPDPIKKQSLMLHCNMRMYLDAEKLVNSGTHMVTPSLSATVSFYRSSPATGMDGE